MNTVEALKLVREKLAAGWTQHVYARDKFGVECGSTDPRAESHCIYGAIDSLQMNDPDKRRELSALFTAEVPLEYSGLTLFNDARTTTQADVLNLIDRTIARVRGVQE